MLLRRIVWNTRGWQFQALGEMLAVYRSFRRPTIVMPRRIRAARCMDTKNVFKKNPLMVVRHSPGTIRDAFAPLPQ
jgi:hypothetical protein